MDYKKKHTLIRREALFTIAAAVLVLIFWWAAGFGLKDSGITLFFLPGWFVIGSFGSWFLAIGLSVFLVKCIFTDFRLDDDNL